MAAEQAEHSGQLSDVDWDELLGHLPEQPAGDGWLTLDEASAAAGVARSTLRSWYRAGHIPSRMVLGAHGPQRLVCLDAVLDRALRSSAAAPGSNRAARWQRRSTGSVSGSRSWSGCSGCVDRLFGGAGSNQLEESRVDHGLAPLCLGAEAVEAPRPSSPMSQTETVSVSPGIVGLEKRARMAPKRAGSEPAHHSAAGRAR